MKKRIYTLSVVIALAFGSWAKVSTLTGVEPSYAGMQMQLKMKLDEMANLTVVLDSCVADSAGRFHFSADIPSPRQVFIPSETSNGFLYIEPGKDYTLQIPPRQERTLAQKLDPFYKPTDVLVGINGLKQGDFNYKMMEFEDAFDFYTMRHLVYGAHVDSILSSINQMKEIFNDLYEDPFQGAFMEYRFLLLLNSSSQVYKDSIIVRLNTLGADEYNPAFWDIFNNLFENFIPQLAYDRQQYLAFQKVIEEGNVKMYFALLTRRYGITDPSLRELVAIKLLYDLLYQDAFDRYKVVELLQGIGSGISSQQNRDLLTYILDKASTDFVGSPAPDFAMVDLNGKKRNLSDFIGKYIYLNLTNSIIGQTQKDLEVLLRFQRDFKNELEILNVGLYDRREALEKLQNRFGGKLQFLLAQDPDQLKELYSIKSIPYFLLIDKDGNLLMTKGAEPTDELRMFLQKIFQSH